MASFDLITYFLNPAEHFAKRIFVFICIIGVTFLVDGYVGFSEFYFQKNKVETLLKISEALKDTTISIKNRETLRSSYDNIIQKESYKVKIFSFLKSIRDNTSSINFTLRAHPTHAPNGEIITAPPIHNSSSLLTKISLHVFTSGLLYWLFIFYFIFKLSTSQPFRLIARDRGVYKAILVLVIIVIGLSIIFILMPPYEFGTRDKYIFNLVFNFVSVFFALGIIDSKLGKKKENEEA
jgi:hypothetical protein